MSNFYLNDEYLPEKFLHINSNKNENLETLFENCANDNSLLFKK